MLIYRNRDTVTVNALAAEKGRQGHGQVYGDRGS